MMESEVMGNYHASFGERDRETRTMQAVKVRPVPTPFSPLLANLALHGIENSGKCIRYADDMVFVIQKEEGSEEMRKQIDQELQIRV
jgi:retron-type reverse transcriptase